MLKTFAIATASVVVAGNALAQCSNYSNTPAGTQVLQADDAIRTVPLPFAFPFNGSTYTQIVISSNGWIKLGTSLSTSSDLGETEALMLNNPIVTNNNNPRIAVCWDDLDPDDAGQGVFYAPDAAQVTVSWVNANAFSTATAFANCECVLTITGDIYLKYDVSNNYNTTVTTSTNTPIVGISKSDGTVAPATHTFDWTLATPGPLSVVDATGYQQFTVPNGATPWDLLGGVVLHFAPTGPSTYDVTNTTLSTCAPGTYPPVATASTITGAACSYPSSNGSIYEAFTVATGTNPIDLSNSSLLFVRSGDTYILVPGGPVLDPTYTTNGTILPGVTDDSSFLQTLVMSSFPFGSTSITQVVVGSNGQINLGNSTANPLSSTPATFHALTQGRIAGCNDDLVPNSTTTPIYIENTASMFRATWHNVPFFSIGGSITMQITLDQATGNIAVAYGTITAAVTTTPPLVGLSGLSSVDGGASDLVTAGVTNVVGPRTFTGPTGFTAMSHTTTLATLGNNFTLTTTCTANNFGFGAWLIGGTNPNVPVDAIFGIGQAPGCNIYSDFSVILELLTPFTAGATSFAKTVPVPVDFNLAGLVIHTQAAVFAPANPLNVMTSNGRTQTVGL